LRSLGILKENHIHHYGGVYNVHAYVSYKTKKFEKAKVVFVYNINLYGSMNAVQC